MCLEKKKLNMVMELQEIYIQVFWIDVSNSLFIVKKERVAFVRRDL